MIEKPKKSIMGNGIETIKNLDDLSPSKNYRGRVIFKSEPTGLQEKVLEDACPTKALFLLNDTIALDNGKCIMCGYCSQSVPEIIEISSKPPVPVRIKSQLIDYSSQTQKQSYEQTGNQLKEKIQKIFGRSLAIRQVDAGSCNGCEIEITALNNPVYDIERFGIHFVASPRHADVLLVTGPASRNMEIALLRTYEATPGPKIVVAVGACACSGGIFGDTYATTGGIDKIVPVDVYIPGCPPRPEVLLQGLLLAVNRICLKSEL